MRQYIFYGLNKHKMVFTIPEEASENIPEDIIFKTIIYSLHHQHEGWDRYEVNYIKE